MTPKKDPKNGQKSRLFTTFFGTQNHKDLISTKNNYKSNKIINNYIKNNNKHQKIVKIRKPSKSGQDRHLPGDPKNGQKRQKRQLSGF